MAWKDFPLTQTLTRQRHIDGVSFEFEASQSYVVNSRPAYLTEKDIVLKNEKQRKKSNNLLQKVFFHNRQI